MFYMYVHGVYTTDIYAVHREHTGHVVIHDIIDDQMHITGWSFIYICTLQMYGGYRCTLLVIYTTVNIPFFLLQCINQFLV